MKTFLHYIYKRLARWPLLVFTGVLTVSMFILMWQTSTPRVLRHVIDYQLAFTSARALKVIALWGVDGIALYLNNLWVDFIFSAGYGLFTAGLVALAIGRQPFPPRGRHLFFFSLPLIALASDYLENSLHILMLSAGFLPDPWLLLAASLAAAIKWGSLLISVIVILFFLARRLLPKNSNKERAA